MVRIATWNVAGTGRTAWEHVVSAVPADIVLLQESRDPSAYLEPRLYREIQPFIVWERNQDNSGKGIAIFTRGLPIRALQFRHHPGWAQVADVQTADGAVIRFINIHGEVKKAYYVTDTLNAILTDLTPMMSARDAVVLGGDLNVSVLYGEVTGNPRHKTFLGRVTAEYGLVNCTARYFEVEPRTIRGRGSRKIKPYQDDYLFVSALLAERLTGADVLDDVAIRGISDHNPVVATFLDRTEVSALH